MIIAGMLVASPAWADHGKLEAWFFDVGKADAALVSTPGGHTVLIDAGGNGARRVAAQELKRRLVAPLDLAILTHPHPDHGGGMVRALNVRGVRDVYEPGLGPGAPDVADFYHWLKKAQRKGELAVHRVRAPTTPPVIFDDGTRVEFLAPSEPLFTGTVDDLNANSVIVRVIYRQSAILFEGDASAEAEERLLEQGKEVRADVLKVAHHGANGTSTPAWLEAVSARIGVISVREDGSRQHPHRATLRRLQRAGAQIWRTDDHGTIHVSLDGARHVDVKSTR